MPTKEMLSILWDPPSASRVPFNTEPTAYELHCQRQRELRELEQQINRFGADAMKVDPRLPLDAPLPPENFERALQMRMPDQKAANLSKRGDVRLASTDYALGKGEMVFGYEMAKN